MKLPVLPVYYYLDHFEEMLVFVGKTYGGILTAEHHEFMGRFSRLSRDARCLLIRMINRRGAIFNRALFKYAEISDIESALAELSAFRQARQLKEDDYVS
jgi:DNA polymerase-3 subunit epsilon